MPEAQLDRRSLSAQVAERLRRDLLAGEYQPGERLQEPELAKRFGVSLTPVREALATMAASGLVVRAGRQGTYVRVLGIDDLENLFAVRETIELLAVKQAIPFLTQADDRRLRRNLEQQAQATEVAPNRPKEALTRLAALNDELHQLIVERSRNEWLASMYASIQDLLVFSRARLRQSATPERRHATLQEHTELVEALVARDVAAASEHMSRHVLNLKQHVVELWRIQPEPSRGAGGRPARSPAATEVRSPAEEVILTATTP